MSKQQGVPSLSTVAAASLGHYTLHRAAPRPSPRPLSIVLLHGWQQDSTCWGETPDRLATNGFDVVAIDFYAHGDSIEHGPDETLTTDDLETQAIGVLRSLDWVPPAAEEGLENDDRTLRSETGRRKPLRRMVIMACSLGCAVALRLLGRFGPTVVHGLVLIAPAGTPEEGWRMRGLAPLNERLSRLGRLGSSLRILSRFHTLKEYPTYGVSGRDYEALSRCHLTVHGAKFDEFHTPKREFWMRFAPHVTFVEHRKNHAMLCTMIESLELEREEMLSAKPVGTTARTTAARSRL